MAQTRISFLARYTPDGLLDNTFGSSGQVQTDFGTNQGQVASVASEPDGKIIVAGTERTSANSTVIVVERFNADGSLDQTFGTGGKASAGDGNVNIANGLALQGDGKILVVGSVNGSDTASFDLEVVRFNADGSLDSGFGAGGMVDTPMGEGFDGASGVVVQSDGEIVVAGSALSETNSILALARYDPNGTLDNDFGTDGLVKTSFSGSIAGSPTLALQADGRIVCALGSRLARFNPNGSVDNSFGMGGEVTTSFHASNLTISADGTIIVAGGTLSTADLKQQFLLRYNPDGSLDTTLGTGGEVITDFQGEATANSVLLQSDGKLVAVGSSQAAFVGSVSSFALARYTADGSLDATFGMAGKVVTPVSGIVSAPANAAAVQPDGKIVVVGGAFDLARYDPDGSLDAGFGAGGTVTNAFGSVLSSLSVANAVVLQPDGKIVVVGSTGTQPLQMPPPAFAVARFNADGSPDVLFGNGGIVTTSFTQFDEAFAVAIQADGKIVVVGKAAGLGGDFALVALQPRRQFRYQLW